jgi:predicted nucleic acid-binding protein
MQKPALIDANIVLRLLLGDVPRQAADAADLFARAPEGTLTLSALTTAEVVWVLSSHFHVPRPSIAAALQRVVAQPSVAVSAMLRDAIARFAASTLDFGDCVLAAESAATGSAVITFDRELREHAQGVVPANWP